MLETTKVTIRGIVPLLMHSGNLADPDNPAAMELARLTGKRKKTPADRAEISKTEWFGGIYVDENGHPALPGEVLEACLVDGAKKTKRGKDAKAGIVVDGAWPIDYKGPKDVSELWENGGFVKRAAVRVGQVRVIRTRPMFPNWSVMFPIQWDPGVWRDQSDILDLVRAAGGVGVGTWRPKFGRFELAGVK
jgi:hypothetical protein